MIENNEASEQGMSEGTICALIDGQIARRYDSIRMRKAWEKVLDGTTSSEVIVRALITSLSFGRYERRVQPTPQVINIYVSGVADPEKIAAALGDSISSISNRG